MPTATAFRLRLRDPSVGAPEGKLEIVQTHVRSWKKLSPTDKK